MNVYRLLVSCPDQHSSDPIGGAFFLRMELTAEGHDLDELRGGFDVDHCLLDLLWRIRRGEFDAMIEAVVSNHTDTREDVEAFGIPFHHVPVARDAKPDAERRLVELIGATAHYVTEELDAGPIIEQAVSRVNHRDDVEALKRVGAGTERDVLARAVKWHCEDRVVRHPNTTVVF